MNKRITKKHKKIKNMKKQNIILNELSKHFKIINKNFKNGYFIFSFGENSVCHFSIKETPDWLYGIWLDDNNNFSIFGEHVDLIDKFKPSRTYLSFKNDLKGFIEDVKNISNNPKLYFVDSLTNGDALVPCEKYGDNDNIWYIGYQVERIFNEETNCYNKYVINESITQEDFVNKEYEKYQKEKQERLENEAFDRKYAFKFFKELPNTLENIIAVGIIDGNREGFKSYPRYRLKIVVDKELSKEKFDELYNTLEQLIWDKSHNEEEKITSEHQFSFFGCYDNLECIKNCNYKYYKDNQ